MAPGAVMVVTTTASDASSNFAKAKQYVTDTYPAVSVSLGPTTEAVVAQRPGDDATPIVDMLRQAPFAVGAFLALVRRADRAAAPPAHEPEPSEAVRALIGRVIDQQHDERDAYLSALRVYKEETARLIARRSPRSRAELARQIEAARAGSASTWSAEFLDRVDQLSSKISTSAARYSGELAEKDALIEAQERRVEAYAGLAATPRA